MDVHEQVSTIIVGAGQAGLAAAHFLEEAGDDYLMLDGGPGFGHTWRDRWDSLRLFTPAKFNSLPGMPFPGESFSFPTKDEAADYLEAYARKLQPPVRFNAPVDSLTRDEHGFVLKASGRRYSAAQVIVASGAYRGPSIPALADELQAGIRQLHSSEYRNPAQIPPGAILVVGAGNSGAEIAVELAEAGRDVLLAGRDVGRIPADRVGHVLGGHPYWFFISRILSVDTPIGRRVREASLSHGTPLIGLRPEAVAEAGVRRVPRVVEVRQGQPALSDGRPLAVSSVVWATGFRPNYAWIHLPIFDRSGYPRHTRGVVNDVPGLYFLGLPFQVSLSSTLLGGVGRDARRIAEHLRRHPKRRQVMASAAA